MADQTRTIRLGDTVTVECFDENDGPALITGQVTAYDTGNAVWVDGNLHAKDEIVDEEPTAPFISPDGSEAPNAYPLDDPSTEPVEIVLTRSEWESVVGAIARAMADLDHVTTSMEYDYMADELDDLKAERIGLADITTIIEGVLA